MKYIYIVEIKNLTKEKMLWGMAFADELQAERIWKQVIREHGNKKDLKIIMKKNGKVVKFFNKK